ncbi:MAG: ABC transporter ATP-binding protein [Chloroflexota bacterium]
MIECQPAAEPILEVSSASVTYRSSGREIVALRDVSLSLNEGEVVGLVGPNGSGKTTLIRVVTAVVRPGRGRVVIGGRDIRRMRQIELARQIAVVPQEPVLPPAFTALACVLMGRTPHLRLLQNEGLSDLEAARRAMLATDTWAFADRMLGELSGGERQRVVVARALAQETPILLLDEPTAHLDLGHQASVLGLMHRFALDEGKAVLAVVHDLTLAARYCDRLVMMRHGSIVASGSPSEVLTTERLREVYGVSVDVFPHPSTGLPVVAPGSDG